jgi:hypothetical protein
MMLARHVPQPKIPLSPRRRMSAYADGRERAGVRGRRVHPHETHSFTAPRFHCPRRARNATRSNKCKSCSFFSSAP